MLIINKNFLKENFKIREEIKHPSGQKRCINFLFIKLIQLLYHQ